MQTFRISLFVSSLVLLSACGGGAKPLTKDQKERFAKIVASTLQVGAVSQGVAERSAGTRSRTDFSNLLGMSQLRNDPIYTPMEEALSQCEATFKSSNPSFEDGTGGDMLLSFSLKSAACPVRMNFSFKQSFNSKGISMSLASTYSVANDSFRKYSDVDAFTMNFALDAKNLVESGAGSIRGSGFVNSQELGRIDVTLSGSVVLKEREVSSQATMTFKFPDFVAVLKTSTKNTPDGKTENKLLLNGEEITEDELQQLLKSAIGNRT